MHGDSGQRPTRDSGLTSVALRAPLSRWERGRG